MKEYSVYVFDLYGTLVDIRTDEDSPSFWKKACVLFESCGASYGYAELKNAYFRKISELEKKNERAGHHIEIDLFEVFSFLLNDKGVFADRDMIVSLMERFRDLSVSHIRLYRNAVELLEMLREKGKKVYLLSNAQRIFTMKELRDLKIEDLFDGIFISSDVGFKKPDSVFYRTLLDKYGYDPKDCLMIGNDPICDVEGALKAGMDAYFIESGLSPKGITCADATYRQKGMDMKRSIRKIKSGLKDEENVYNKEKKR